MCVRARACVLHIDFIDNMILQGDFLVHFMDIARDELTKKLDDIHVEKLQVWSFFLLFSTLRHLFSHYNLVF